MSDNRPRARNAGERASQRRRLWSIGVALVGALLPGAARAAEEQGRALEASGDFGTVALVTILAAGGVLLLATLGRLYQRQRGIRWRFQDPDPPHDAGSH